MEVTSDGQTRDSASLPFGDDLSIVGTATDATEHHYTGKERDSESGNDYFGARYYASTMGRFMSPDWSASPAAVPYATLANPQTLNLYAYVGNNPISGEDADGHARYGPSSSFVEGPDGSDGTADFACGAGFSAYCSSGARESVAEGGYETRISTAQPQTDTKSHHDGLKHWFFRLLGVHQTVFKVTSRLVIGGTVISGVADGGLSEAAVPAEVAGEAALETAAEAEVAVTEAAEATQASEGVGAQAIDKLESIEKAQQRVRSGADGGKRIIDVIQKSADRVGHLLNRITQGDYDPDDWE